MVRLLQSCVLHLGADSYGRFEPESSLSSTMRDYISSLECVVDHALDNDVQLVLFAGDAHKTCDPPACAPRGAPNVSSFESPQSARRFVTIWVKGTGEALMNDISRAVAEHFKYREVRSD